LQGAFCFTVIAITFNCSGLIWILFNFLMSEIERLEGQSAANIILNRAKKKFLIFLKILPKVFALNYWY